MLFNAIITYCQEALLQQTHNLPKTNFLIFLGYIYKRLDVCCCYFVQVFFLPLASRVYVQLRGRHTQCIQISPPTQLACKRNKRDEDRKEEVDVAFMLSNSRKKIDRGFRQITSNSHPPCDKRRNQSMNKTVFIVALRIIMENGCSVIFLNQSFLSSVSHFNCVSHSASLTSATLLSLWCHSADWAASGPHVAHPCVGCSHQNTAKVLGGAGMQVEMARQRIKDEPWSSTAKSLLSQVCLSWDFSPNVSHFKANLVKICTQKNANYVRFHLLLFNCQRYEMTSYQPCDSECQQKGSWTDRCSSFRVLQELGSHLCQH